MLEMCYEYDTLGRNVFLEAWSPLFVLFCLRCNYITSLVSSAPIQESSAICSSQLVVC